jgi:hypothetical protein
MEQEIVEQKMETVQLGGNDVVYLQDKATIDMQISTAKAYPRNIRRATDNAVAVVTMDFETASTCTYAVPRGGKQITGASVHLAKILAQFWGNLRVEAKVINIDHKHITSQAIAYDLENNLAIKVEVKRSIVGKYGRFNDDMITVTGNAGNSIAMRNAILSVIPRAVVDKVYKSALSTITGDVSDKAKLIAKRKQVLDTFNESYGVSEQEVLKSIGKASLDNITAEDIVTLIGIGQAIKDGDTSIEEAFRGKKEKTSNATTEKPTEEIVVKESEALKSKKAEAKNKNGELPLN